MNEIKSHYLFEFLDVIKTKGDYNNRRNKSDEFYRNIQNGNLGPIHIFDEYKDLPDDSIIDNELEEGDKFVKVDNSVYRYSSIYNPDMLNTLGFYDEDGYLCYSNIKKNKD